MIPQEKVRQIIQRLLERSRLNEVAWQGTRNGYVVRFPRSWLGVDYGSPDTEPDFVSIEIGRSDRESIGYWRFSENEDGWNEARELYWEAERAVVGWDRVLSDVEAALNEQGKIGLPPLLPNVRTLDHGDLPF